MGLHFAGAGFVGEGKSAAPVFGNGFALQGFEEGLGVGVGDGEHGNLGDRLDLVEGDELDAGFGADAGGLRVTGVDRHIHHAAALRAFGRTHGAFGIRLAAVVAVVFGVGVDDAADGAVLGSDLGLDAAPGLAVAGDDDGSFDGDTHGVEFLVVRGRAVVDVDERCGDVAIARVGVVGGELLIFLVRGGIDGEDRLVEFGGESVGAEEFELAGFWRGEECFHLFDLGVEAVGLELGDEPLGVVLVVGRADVVRARGEAAHVFANAIGFGDGAEFLLPLHFGGGVSGGIAAEGFGVGGVHGPGIHGQDEKTGKNFTHAAAPHWK